MKECVIVQPNDTTNNNHVLYAAITVEAATCYPLCIHYIHIKGHQDKNNDNPLMMEAAQPHLLIDGKIICRWVIPRL